MSDIIGFPNLDTSYGYFYIGMTEHCKNSGKGLFPTSNKYYKYGITKDIDVRLKYHKKECPSFKYLAWWKINAYKHFEDYYREWYTDRMSEWFTICSKEGVMGRIKEVNEILSHKSTWRPNAFANATDIYVVKDTWSMYE